MPMTIPMALQLGIGLSLLCALLTNLAFLLKHRGAAVAPPVTLRRPLASARGLFASRWFAVGMAVALAAWALHVAAIALAPLSLVQAVIAGGLVWLAVLSERVCGHRAGLRQWIGVAMTGAGMAMLAATAPGGGGDPGFSHAAMLAFEVGLAATGVALVLSPRIGSGHAHEAVALAAAAGILFGVADVAIKAISELGLSGLATSWVPFAIAAGIGAFYSSARALQLSEPIQVITVTAAAANLSTIAAGLAVFGDPMPGDPLGLVVQLGAFALVIGAAAVMPAPARLVRHASA